MFSARRGLGCFGVGVVTNTRPPENKKHSERRRRRFFVLPRQPFFRIRQPVRCDVGFPSQNVDNISVVRRLFTLDEWHHYITTSAGSTPDGVGDTTAGGYEDVDTTTSTSTPLQCVFLYPSLEALTDVSPVVKRRIEYLLTLFDSLARRYPNIEYYKVEVPPLRGSAETTVRNEAGETTVLKNGCEGGANAKLMLSNVHADHSEEAFGTVGHERRLVDYVKKVLGLDAVPATVWLRHGVEQVRVLGVKIPKLIGENRKFVRVLLQKRLDALSDSEVRAFVEPILFPGKVLVGGLGGAGDITGRDDFGSSRSREDHGGPAVVLCAKGTREDPLCGFSRMTIEILEEYAAEGTVSFSVFDVFADDFAAEALKRYGEWPTFPALYVDGILIGGHDIISEMHAEGSLRAVLERGVEVGGQQSVVEDVIQGFATEGQMRSRSFGNVLDAVGAWSGGKEHDESM